MRDETLQEAAASYANLRLEIWNMSSDAHLRAMLEIAFTRGAEWADEKRQREFDAIVQEVAGAQ